MALQTTRAIDRDNELERIRSDYPGTARAGARLVTCTQRQGKVMSTVEHIVFVDHAATTEKDQEDVLAFTNLLRDKGVQATVDLHYKMNPPSNWNVWFGEKASAADFLLLIISKSMSFRLSSSRDQNPDAQTVQSVVFGSDRNKVVPIFLNEPVDENLIPLTLRGTPNYAIRINATESGSNIVEDHFYIALYARLTKQLQHEVPPVGEITHYSREQVAEAMQSVEMSRAKGRPRHVGSDLTDSGRLWYTGDVKTDAGAGAGALPHDLSSYLCTEESLKGQGHVFSDPPGEFIHRPQAVIGRECEIENMQLMLSPESQVDIVGLFGSAGSGKSHTAKVVAMQLKAAHPSLQVILIDMNDCPSKDTWGAHFLEKIWGSPVTNPNDATEDLQCQIRASDKRRLLLIDNCECAGCEIESFREFIASLLGGGRGRVRCLLISQRRFLIQRNGINMKSPQWGSLCNDDATSLFLETAEGKCSEGAASRICSLCGNIPLTIKGAASMVGSGRISDSELLRDLETKNIFQVLDFADGDMSLTFMLKTSFERWSKPELEAFVRLCVFPGSFSPQLAAAVLRSTSQKTKATIWTLANVQEHVNGQYKLHNVYREFGLYLAREMAPLEFGPVLDEAKKSFLVACSHLVTELSERFEQDVLEVRDTFSAQHHNIKQFMADAAHIPEGLKATYISAALYCPFLLDTFVSADERISFYQHCVEAAAAVGNKLEECQLRYWLAQDLVGEGDISNANLCIADADQLFEQLNEHSPGQTKSLCGLRQYTSSLLLNRGERDKQDIAASCFQEAVELFVDLSTMQLQQSVVIPMFLCGSLGIRSLTECSSFWSRGKGSSDRSIQFANASLKLCDHLSKPECHPDRLMCLNSHAIAQMSNMRFKEAHDTFETAVKIQKKLTEKHRDVAILLSNAAQCLAKMHNYQEAGVKFVESFDMLKDLYGDEHKETLRSRYELAVNDERCGKDESAVEHYRHIVFAVEKLNVSDKHALDFPLDVVEKQLALLEKEKKPSGARATNYSFLFPGASNQ